MGTSFMPYTKPLEVNKVFEKAQKAKLKAAAQKTRTKAQQVQHVQQTHGS